MQLEFCGIYYFLDGPTNLTLECTFFHERLFQHKRKGLLFRLIYFLGTKYIVCWYSFIEINSEYASFKNRTSNSAQQHLAFRLYCLSQTSKPFKYIEKYSTREKVAISQQISENLHITKYFCDDRA